MTKPKRVAKPKTPPPPDLIAARTPPAPGETFDLADVKARADRLGCFMQMFVAYNPDTETFVFASNDPCAGPGKPSAEAALLATIVVEALAEGNGELH